MARIEAVLPPALEQRVSLSQRRFWRSITCGPAPLREPMAALREGMESGRKFW